MSGFFGSPAQIAVQRRLFENHAEIAASPYLSNGGRILNILDPDALGWDIVRSYIKRDLFVGLTAVPLDKTLAKLRTLFGEHAEYPYWNVFLGKAPHVITTCEAVIGVNALPEGWRAETLNVPGDHVIDAMRVLNAETGVMPTPTYYLRSEVFPSLTTCVWSDSGALAACANATMRYHPKSRFANTLFAGGVSVAPEFRKRGLGALTNAILLRYSHALTRWTSVLEQAREDNLPSCAMIQKCGLAQDPILATIVVNLSGGNIIR
ncbi:MAG: GNAT family N-acetyltransferase [Paracoccaceae bacterium]